MRLLHVGWLLFHHEQAAILLYFLVMLPGVVLHEFSHLVVAAMLGVSAGGLTVWPKVHRQGLQLGSVQVARTDILRESLIGLAPLIAGSLAILSIAGLVFNVPLSAQGNIITWLDYVANHADRLLTQDNAAIWLYLIFTVSNAMLPSPSDRQPWRDLVVFVGIIAGIALLMNGGIPQIPKDVITNLTRALDLLTISFAFTIIVDIIFIAGIFVVEQILIAFRGSW